MNYKLVVSKYNENIDWLHFFDQSTIVLYDKSDAPIGIPRKNVGRESETFLAYIIENYYELPEYVVFVQGNPFEHMKDVRPENFRSNIEDILKTNTKDSVPLLTNLHEEQPDLWPGLHVRSYYKYLFGLDCPEKTYFAAGCQYIVHKESILFHSIEKYKKLYDMVYSSPVTTCSDAITINSLSDFSEKTMSAWTFERFGYYLFSRMTLLEN
jgi:hypothetical protein